MEKQKMRLFAIVKWCDDQFGFTTIVDIDGNKLCSFRVDLWDETWKIDLEETVYRRVQEFHPSKDDLIIVNV